MVGDKILLIKSEKGSFLEDNRNFAINLFCDYIHKKSIESLYRRLLNLDR